MALIYYAHAEKIAYDAAGRAWSPADIELIDPTTGQHLADAEGQIFMVMEANAVEGWFIALEGFDLETGVYSYKKWAGIAFEIRPKEGARGFGDAPSQQS